MDAETLRQRIHEGENLITEFKVASIHPDDLSASLVAFANTSGGEIIFGVSDKGEIVGVEKIDELGKFVDNVSRDKCLPAVTILQEKMEAEGQALLVVRIPQGDERPYSTNRGVHYIRTFSGRRQASREELLRIFQASQSLYYEETPIRRANLTALDYSYFEYFLAQAYGKKLDDFAVSKEQLLTNLRLAKDGHPTIAGILLCGRDSQALMPYAQINTAQFSGAELADAPADRKDIGGKLADQLEGAMRFLNVHLRVQHKIKGIEPERYPELPEEALRETLVNALIHRDYTIRGPIRLFVFQDRVEVHSPGKPPNAVDVETMRLGTHVPRNPILLSHFAKLGYVTSLGTGVPRIIRLVSQAVGKEPDIAVRDFEVTVSIPRRQVES
jgi:ATP-dependent DNA helicase RecG